jgi:hypothetical protein
MYFKKNLVKEQANDPLITGHIQFLSMAGKSDNFNEPNTLYVAKYPSH